MCVVFVHGCVLVCGRVGAQFCGPGCVRARAWLWVGEGVGVGVGAWALFNLASHDLNCAFVSWSNCALKADQCVRGS